jgi:hypothetical protein
VPKTLGAEAHKRENVDFAGQWDKIVIVPYHVCAPMCLGGAKCILHSHWVEYIKVHRFAFVKAYPLLLVELGTNESAV